MEAASDDQKQNILPQVAEGNMVLTLAMTEADYSWEPQINVGHG